MESTVLYFLSFFYSMLMMHIYHNKKRKWNISKQKSILNKLLWAFVIILFPLLLACFRDGIGIDYQNYQIYFEKCRNFSLTDFITYRQSYEILNLYIIKFAYFLFGNTQGVFALYSIITLELFTLSIMDNDEQISTSLSIFVLLCLLYSGSYNTVRQFLAMSIIFYSLKYIRKGSIINYYTCILIAILIHTSSVIAIPLYFLVHKKQYKNRIITNIVRCAIILFPIFITFFMNIASNIFIFSRFFDNYSSGNYDIITSYILKLPVLIPIVLCAKILYKNKEETMFFLYLYIYELVLLYTSVFYKWGFRLSYFVTFGQIYLVGFIVKKSANLKTKCLISGYFIIWYLFQFWLLYSQWGRDGIFPYIHI